MSLTKTWHAVSDLLRSCYTLPPARQTLLLCFSLLAIFGVLKTLYNVYLHPLRSHPGPWLARASRWYYAYYLKIGRLNHKVTELHEIYGDCVRIAPNELSYNVAQAWQDICGHRSEQRSQSFEKDLTFFPPAPNGVDSIIVAKNDAHRRFRRLLSHPMSEKALQSQEEIIVGYVDLLILQLRKKATSTDENIVEIVRWFNFTAFDILGDLAFGEPFGCLKSGIIHPWITLVFTAINSVMDMQSIRRVPGLFSLIQAISVMRQSKDLRDQFNFCQRKVRDRVARDTDRPDFITYILRATQEKGIGMTQDEIEANSQILIMAGTETTPSGLSGTLFYILTHPTVREKLLKELCTAFKNESEITASALQYLTYLNATIQESLRLYPPAPCTFPRTTPPGGSIICGTWVPGGYSVGVNQMATYLSEKNFEKPHDFAPERWLGDELYKRDIKKAYQPFSFGPRNCLGRNLAYAEMRLVLSRLLWNFDMTLQEDSLDWNVGQKAHLSWAKPDMNVKLTRVNRNRAS